jgi:4-hydroxy-4-methyl-2-oxoglutarate aldolase
MKTWMLPVSLLLLITFTIQAQQVTPAPEQIKAITHEWTGERSPDGRPKVDEKFFKRLKKVRLEEAWGILRNKGYQNKFEGE